MLRSAGVFSASSLLTVPKDLPVEAAATVAVPCTAFRLLTDFAALKGGDVVLQNGADGPVGQAVVQIAKEMGLKTVSIVADGPGYAATAEQLKALGADIVVSDTYAQTAEFTRLWSDMPQAALALNGVGGSSVHEMTRHLGEGATMVTYGGATRQAVAVPTSAFVSKGLQLSGFNLGRWLDRSSKAEAQAMLDSVVPMVSSGKVKLATEAHSFAEFDSSLDAALSAEASKVVVMM